jgi:hypothetical protein
MRQEILVEFVLQPGVYTGRRKAARFFDQAGDNYDQVWG